MGTSSTIWPKATLRSSSPCINNTGDFHVETEATGEDSLARFDAGLFCCGCAVTPGGSGLFATCCDQSCTPWKSTPAANKSEFRASPMAVKYQIGRAHV